MATITTLARRGVLLAAVMALAACGLPRAGPNGEEIVAGAKAEGGPINVVLVDMAIAAASRSDTALRFPPSFINAPVAATDRINPGDTLTITIWENVDNGLLANAGQRASVLQGVQVDQRGRIFVPFAGSLEARGRTPDELRRDITASLEERTPDPQVEVRRISGDGASVSVIGGVGAQGVYPILPSNARLSSMLATAGGVQIEADVAQVAIRRRGETGRIFLRDLFDNPAFDIALRPGDQIIVEEDRRTYTALGATSAQARVRFPQGRISVVEALAQVGGLNSNLSNPTGVFVLRREHSDIATRVTGQADIADGEPFAYIIDLTEPDGIFVAREFEIRDDDTLYVTEAPFVAWSRVLNAVSQTLGFTNNVTATVDRLN
ncbi:MAG: polysaccharide biosynthesis/export family protein [Pseudomonadota bacterium]